MDFWHKLKKPFFVLAPMDGATDVVFRQIITSVGKPDVFFTEFVPVEAILSSAQEKVINNSLQLAEKERPVVAQIWGTDPDKFYQSAQIISKLGFDGIDINMGCPDRSVIKKGACSGLIRTPELAVKIIEATIKGANGLPVSVKTRIGFDEIDTENWISTILKTPISNLTVHLRTVAEMSKVPAHWDEIEKVVNLRNKLNPNVLIVGNGDIKSIKEAKEKVEKYQIDGVMIGRGIFENVYLFNENIDPNNITPEQKFNLLLDHLYLFQETWGDSRNFEIMKRFVKCYVNNFNGATYYREKLMKTKSLEELINSVSSLQRQLIESQ